MEASVICELINKNDRRQVELIRYRERLAQRILGERYDGVYDFFCDVLEDESTYKILRARRCQILFELFVQIILLNEDFQIRGTFLSTNALENHINILCDNAVSVLIVDDVLIHGRGIKQLYERLDPSCSRSSVRIMVYCRSLNATYIDERLEKCFFKKYLSTFDYEWRNISTCFVELIIASVIPYESFAGSLEQFTLFSRNNSEASFNIIENLKSEFESTYILFEKKAVPPFLESIGYDACLRVYTSSKLNATAYVPYVFLKNISISAIPMLFRFIIKHLDKNNFANIIQLLSVEDSGLSVYQMRLFSALANRIYSVYLSKEYHVLDDALPNRVNMELCFGHGITEELLKISYEDISSLLVKQAPYSVGTVIEDPDLETSFKIYFPDEEYIYSFLSMYYYINGQFDEESAKKRLNQKVGLTMAYFYDKADTTFRHAMTAAQLKCWDYGQASGVMKSGNETIAMYGIAGEQNFRFILQENKEFFRSAAARYSSYFMEPSNEDYSKNNMPFASSKEPKDFPNEKKLYQMENKRLLNEFLIKNSSRLAEWYIPQILS